MPPRGERRSYRCPKCNNTFAKAEHLARHERTHTGSKPFSCRVCAQRFSRQDSLVRHLKRDLHPRTLDNDVAGTSNSMLDHSEVATINANPHSYSFHDFENIAHSEALEQRDRLLPQDTLTSDSTIDAWMPEQIVNNQLFQLTWPDSADFLQSLLSADFGTWQPPLETFPSQSILGNSHLASERQSRSPWLATDSTGNTVHSGNDAVRDLSLIITSLSVDVVSEAESTGLTSAFLDGCLHMFFTNFVPSLPVVHRPTFVFRDWTHPLLLNSIALGSLFMSQEQKTLKGETLWRLAHTAVATSWNTLIEHQGPHDSCSGVQLILTALLGQVYAMFSTNITLRRTAQIFHSLGFYWARECGMYEDEGVADRPAGFDTTHDAATEEWKKWAARESQLRALLGHYILDSQIAHYTGGPTCQRHASNYLRPPCDNVVFEADTVVEWSSRMRAVPARPTTFAELFNALFTSQFYDDYLRTSVSPLTAAVLLEGLKSFVLECNVAKGRVVGIPDKPQTLSALGNLHLCIMASNQMSPVDRCNARLRWHAVSLDADADSIILCQQMCVDFNIAQNIFGGKHRKSQSFVILKNWVSTSEAKRALLHAIAIWDTLQDLPLGRLHAIHIPASIFSAAIVYCAYCIVGVPVVQIPTVINWQYVMGGAGLAIDAAMRLGEDVQVTQYFTNQLDPSRFRGGETRNLLYDLNSFPRYLKSLSRPWGIAANMAEILEQLIACCNT